MSLPQSSTSACNLLPSSLHALWLDSLNPSPSQSVILQISQALTLQKYLHRYLPPSSLISYPGGTTLPSLPIIYPALSAPTVRSANCINIGLLRGFLGETYLASLAFESALDLTPRHPLAWYGLGCARFQLKLWRGARSAFKQCLECFPLLPSDSVSGCDPNASVGGHDKDKSKKRVEKVEYKLRNLFNGCEEEILVLQRTRVEFNCIAANIRHLPEGVNNIPGINGIRGGLLFGPPFDEFGSAVPLLLASSPASVPVPVSALPAEPFPLLPPPRSRTTSPSWFSKTSSSREFHRSKRAFSTPPPLHDAPTMVVRGRHPGGALIGRLFSAAAAAAAAAGTGRLGHRGSHGTVEEEEKEEGKAKERQLHLGANPPPVLKRGIMAFKERRIKRRSSTTPVLNRAHILPVSSPSSSSYSPLDTIFSTDSPRSALHPRPISPPQPTSSTTKISNTSPRRQNEIYSETCSLAYYFESRSQPDEIVEDELLRSRDVRDVRACNRGEEEEDSCLLGMSNGGEDERIWQREEPRANRWLQGKGSSSERISEGLGLVERGCARREMKYSFPSSPSSSSPSSQINDVVVPERIIGELERMEKGEMMDYKEIKETEEHKLREPGLEILQPKAFKGFARF